MNTTSIFNNSIAAASFHGEIVKEEAGVQSPGTVQNTYYNQQNQNSSISLLKEQSSEYQLRSKSFYNQENKHVKSRSVLNTDIVELALKNDL